ncbi:MAG: hypothetical protein Q9M50_03695 [Methylococcales bacterium]|nr:hypothetical protein [Methylococcales bacterium]
MVSDEIAHKMLIKLGYVVEKIPESEKEEADFLVKYQGSTALLEAKLKKDDPSIVKKREASLSAGKVSVVEAKLGINSNLSKIIDKANSQLLSSSDKPHDFKIVSFIASGINEKTKTDQFKDTIYGSTLVSNGNNTKTCYFFRDSAFYKRNNIDAAIVGYVFNNEIILELCLNPYSLNYNSLKESVFLEPFKGAVIDPLKLENKGLAYIPDHNIDRKLNEFQKNIPSHNPILIHLQEKYKTGFLINIDWDSPELAIRIKT